MKTYLTSCVLICLLMPIQSLRSECFDGNESVTRGCCNSDCNSKCIKYKGQKAFCNLIAKELQVQGSAFISDLITNTLRVTGNVQVDGDVTIEGTLIVDGVEINTNALSEWAYITNTSDVQQIIPAGDPIPFDQEGIQTSGITHSAGSTDITINSGGTYFVIFSITPVTENTAIQLELGNTLIPSTLYSIDSGAGNIPQNTGFAIITPTSGQVLRLINATPGPITFEPFGIAANAVKASILLIKIGN